MTAAALPDDIEQYLTDGQRLRATVELAERRQVSIEEAIEMVSRWLFYRQRDREGGR